MHAPFHSDSNFIPYYITIKNRWYFLRSCKVDVSKVVLLHLNWYFYTEVNTFSVCINFMGISIQFINFYFIYEMFYIWNILYMKCFIYGIFYVWNILCMKYIIFEKFLFYFPITVLFRIYRFMPTFSMR